MKKIIPITLIVCMIFNILFFPAFNTVKAVDSAEASSNILENGNFESTQKSSSTWKGGIEPTNWGTWKVSGNPTLKIDESTYHEGKKSASIEASTVTRTSINTVADVTPGKKYKLSFWTKTENVKSTYSYGGSYARIQYQDNRGKEIKGGPDIKSLKGTNDWTLIELDVTAPDKVCKFKIELFFETATGKIWFDDVRLFEVNETASFKLQENEISLDKGQSITLNPIFAPENVKDKTIKWESLNSEIATISEDGVITGKGYGVTRVKGTMNYGGSTAECSVTVKPTETSSNIIENGTFESTQNKSTTWKAGVEPTNWGTWIPNGNPILKIDESIYHEGKKSVLMESSDVSRASINTTVNVISGKSYKLTFWTKTENVMSSISYGGCYARTQYLDSAGKKISSGPEIQSLKETNDWILVQLDVPVPDKVSKLKIELFFETATGKVWFDDVKLFEVEPITAKFKLAESEITLNKGQSVTLNPIFEPVDVKDKTIKWESLNTKIATVSEDGVITGKEYGFTTIKGKMNYGGSTAQCLVTVEPNDAYTNYERIRLKWFNRLTGNDKYNPQDSDIVNSVNSVVEKVSNSSKTGSWDTMNRASDRTFLWDDIKNADVSANITSNFSRLKAMALAYSLVGSSFYKNSNLKDDISNALDWMYTNCYNEDKKIKDNWWDWEIGAPQELNDILVLMYDDSSSDQINKYMKAIDKFASDPTKEAYNGAEMTGANRVDKAIVAALRGVVGKNSVRIFQARDAVSQLFLYVDKGDGFYTDGSFIQHTNIPYIGSYGGVLIKSLSNVLFALKDSPWEVVDPNFKNVYNWIIDSYEPLMYKGSMMDMVSGRAISRENYTDHKTGRGTLLNLLKLSEGLPNDKAMIVKSMIKELIQADKTFSNYYDGLSLNDIINVKTLLNDSNIKPRGELIKHKIFPNMDRMVHFTPDFAFAVSMSSKRIANFEYGNKENKKGWFTGYGMSYLYNNDQTQFMDGYWPTVDMFRLPGTTTDATPGTIKDWYSYLSPKTWVGGTSINDTYGATGMEFKIEKSSLTGKKSWFSFDDEIVALGAGITSSDNRKVETIIENRKIKDSGDNTLIVNGEDKTNQLVWNNTTTSGITWANLSGNVENSDIGYYFPEKSNIDVLRETRTGTYDEINTGSSKTPITRNYLSLAFDHGNNPKDASYSYVLLPNKNSNATEEYSKNPDIEILRNDSDVQAVKENKLGITAANFWTNTQQSAGIISADNKASVMVKESEKYLEISVADPTMENKGVINLEIAGAAKEEILKNPEIAVTQLEPTIKFSVNVKGAKGASFNAKFEMKDTTAPVIKLLGNEVENVTKGAIYIDAGATAIDNNDGDITKKIVTTVTTSGGIAIDNIDTNLVDIYTIHYNVIDSVGNAAKEVTRKVVVNPPPFKPEPIKDLVAIAGDKKVTLTFTASEGATNISVEQSINGIDYSMATTESAIAVTSTSAIVANLSNDQEYRFRLVVTGGKNEGISNIVKATPKAIIPPAPVVDKAALIEAIEKATSLLNSKTIGNAVGCVSQAAHDEYLLEIQNAANVKDNVNITQIQINEVVELLANATERFKQSIIKAKPIEDLVATVGDKKVTLTFTTPEGATNISVEQSVNGIDYSMATTESAIAVTSTSAIVIDLNNDQEYSFRLVVTGGRNEGISNVAKVTPKATIPPASVVDKAALIEAIEKATSLLNSKTIGNTVGCVNQAAYDEYLIIIQKAANIKDNANVTQIQVNEAVDLLVAATKKFNLFIVQEQNKSKEDDDTELKPSIPSINDDKVAKNHDVTKIDDNINSVIVSEVIGNSQGYNSVKEQNMVAEVKETIRKSLSDIEVKNINAEQNLIQNIVQIKLNSTLANMGKEISNIINKNLGNDETEGRANNDVKYELNIIVIEKENNKIVYEKAGVETAIEAVEVDNLKDLTSYVIKIDIAVNGKVVGTREKIITTMDKTPPVINEVEVVDGRMRIKTTDKSKLNEKPYMVILTE